MRCAASVPVFADYADSLIGDRCLSLLCGGADVMRADHPWELEYGIFDDAGFCGRLAGEDVEPRSIPRSRTARSSAA